MKTIAISGYYGFGNTGDEAVLAGIVRSLRATPGGEPANLSLCALSIDPVQTARYHEISSAHRYRAGALIGALAKCDLLASGGGSLLQDVTSRHSIFYYLGVVRAAQIMGKRTMFIAQGIGPLRLERSRRLTASVAGRCDAITVRDQASAVLLQEIGVTRTEITVTADPALLLGVHPPIADDGSRAAAISLRPWADAPPGFPTAVSAACAGAIADRPILSMQMSPEDAGVHAEFFAALSASAGKPGLPDAPPLASWPEMTGIAASAGLVIGMRLHALILAAANGVPSVALAYDPKIAAFMVQTGQSDAVFDIRDPDPGKLAHVIRQCWEQRAERAELLRERLPNLKAAANQNAEIAMGLIGR